MNFGDVAKALNLDPELLKLLFLALTGGLAGAMLTWLVTRRRQQIDISYRLINDFASMFSEHANILDWVENVPKLSVEQENSVRRMGNWFDLLALLYRRRYGSKGLLRRAGMKKTMCEFRHAVAQAKDDHIRALLHEWPYLKKLRQGGQ